MGKSSDQWIEQNIDTGRFKEKYTDKVKRQGDYIGQALLCKRDCTCNNCENEKMEQADLEISGGLPKKY